MDALSKQNAFAEIKKKKNSQRLQNGKEAKVLV
jgi:hypothetical protein